jgi:hypothetical protein
MRRGLIAIFLALTSAQAPAVGAQAKPIRLLLVPFGAAHEQEGAVIQEVSATIANDTAGPPVRVIELQWVRTVMNEAGYGRITSRTDLVELAQVLRADAAVGVSLAADGDSWTATTALAVRRDTLVALPRVKTQSRGTLTADFASTLLTEIRRLTHRP